MFVYVGMAEEIPSTSLSWRPSRHTAKMARIIIDSCVRQDTESEEDSFIECDKEFNSLQPSDRNSSSESEEDATPPPSKRRAQVRSSVLVPFLSTPSKRIRTHFICPASSALQGLLSEVPQGLNQFTCGPVNLTAMKYQLSQMCNSKTEL